MSEQRTPKELRRKAFELTLAVYRVTDLFSRGEILSSHLREKASEIFSRVVEYGFTDDLPREASFISAKIRSLNGYLRIGHSLGLAKLLNFIVLAREYDFLDNFFKKELTAAANKKESGGQDKRTELRIKPPEKSVKSVSAADETTSRQRKTARPEIAVKNPPEKEQKQSSEPQGRNNVFNAGEIKDTNERQRAIIQHLAQKQSAKISDFFSFFSDVSPKTIQRDLHDLVNRNVIKKDGERRWTIYEINNVL